MNYGFSQYVSITPLNLYEMNPITIETSNYSTSDTNRGRVQLTCRARADSPVTTIIATKAEVSQMASRIQDSLLVQYDRDFEAPVTAGEIMGSVTYFAENGEAVVYDLVASRTVAVRENVPKTLEQIVQETYADPNPFPEFSLYFAVLFFGPVLLLITFIFLIILLLRRFRKRGARTPRPVNRYLK